jgi:hypothetical protein
VVLNESEISTGSSALAYGQTLRRTSVKRDSSSHYRSDCCVHGEVAQRELGGNERLHGTGTIAKMHERGDDFEEATHRCSFNERTYRPILPTSGSLERPSRPINAAWIISTYRETQRDVGFSMVSSSLSTNNACIRRPTWHVIVGSLAVGTHGVE